MNPTSCLRWLAMPAASLALVACVSQPPLQEYPDVNYAGLHDPTCRAAAMDRLVGRTIMSEKEIIDETGVSFVRQLGPDDSISRDRRTDRAIVFNDLRTGRIVAAICA